VLRVFNAAWTSRCLVESWRGLAARRPRKRAPEPVRSEAAVRGLALSMRFERMLKL
jgi:hypothetical protein